MTAHNGSKGVELDTSNRTLNLPLHMIPLRLPYCQQSKNGEIISASSDDTLLFRGL
jgi:hypothetical protein